jgi:hypothetical protein
MEPVIMNDFQLIISLGFLVPSFAPLTYPKQTNIYRKYYSDSTSIIPNLSANANISAYCAFAIYYFLQMAELLISS